MKDLFRSSETSRDHATIPSYSTSPGPIAPPCDSSANNPARAGPNEPVLTSLRVQGNFQADSGTPNSLIRSAAARVVLVRAH
jgi:hypothetical protein